MSGTTATIVQQQTIADRPAGWSQTLAFNQFDPSLGTLDAVGLSVNADLNGYVALENHEAAPISVGVGQSGEIDATAGSPGFLYNYAIFGAGSSASLAAYDGTTDFAGPSGTVVPLGATGSGEFGSGATQDLGQAIGTGTLPVSVSSDTSVQISGPANLDVISNAAVGASVTLEYTYTPTGSSAHVGGGSLGVDSDTTFNVILAPGAFQNWVTTAPQTFAFADRISGWTDNLSARQFGSALGTLEAVNITIVADTASTVSAENLEPAAENVQSTQTVTVALGGPANISASPTADVNQYLAAYDGVTDFSGTSGFTTGQSSSSESDGQWTDPASLAAFGGNGTITLPVSTSSQATLNGPGNLDAEIRALAGATMTVSYSYLPIGATPGSIFWGDVSGDWATADYWWGGAAPTATDDAAITQAGTYAITLDAAATIHSLVLDSPDATLILDSSLTTTGDIILDAGTLVFAGGTLTAADVILNGGEITGSTVDIDATGSIAFKGGSIVADDVVLLAGSAIAGSLITPATGFAGPGSFVTLDTSHQNLIASLPAGAVTASGSTYKLTTDNASFHAGASGALVGVHGSGDRVYGGTGADTVFGNDGAWVRGGTDSLLFSGGTHGHSTVVGASGASTLYGGSSGNNVLSAGKGAALIVAGGNDIVWGGRGSDTIVGGSATSTVTGGTGAETVFAGTAPMLVYGGTGSLVFVGGGSGGNTVLGGAGAATLFGGSGGNNILSGGAGHAIIVGGGNGDMLMAGGATGDMLFAGAGNETLSGSATGNDMLNAGSGTDVIFAGDGADTLTAGTGTANIIAGSGADMFVFTSGMAGGADAIWNFKPGTDHVLLANYGTDALANALSTAVVRGSSTMITLSDHTQITFGGISHLTTSDFV